MCGLIQLSTSGSSHSHARKNVGDLRWMLHCVEDQTFPAICNHSNQKVIKTGIKQKWNVWASIEILPYPILTLLFLHFQFVIFYVCFLLFILSMPPFLLIHCLFTLLFLSFFLPLSLPFYWNRWLSETIVNNSANK